MERSLNLQDESAREIVKHAFKIVGQEMPEQSLEDRLKESQVQNVASGNIIALEDLSEDSDDVQQNG